jgi:nicotinamidase-related amidase
MAGDKRPDRWSREGEAISLMRPPRVPRPIRFDAQPAPLTVDLSRAALVVVDMQNDFLDPDGWFATVRGADTSGLLGIVPRINALSAAFRDRGAQVIHLNWGIRADLANLPANVVDKGSSCGAAPGYGDTIPSGDVLVQGKWGACSVPAIDVLDGDLKVFKHRLSGFRDNELEAILRRRDVATVFYVGVNLDRCVFATLADGCFQGFDAVLVEDATDTVSPPHVTDAILYLVRLLYGFTTKSDALLGAFQSPTDTGATT